MKSDLGSDLFYCFPFGSQQKRVQALGYPFECDCFSRLRDFCLLRLREFVSEGYGRSRLSDKRRCPALSILFYKIDYIGFSESGRRGNFSQGFPSERSSSALNLRATCGLAAFLQPSFNSAISAAVNSKRVAGYLRLPV